LEREIRRRIETTLLNCISYNSISDYPIPHASPPHIAAINM
jgi:hypothetical protein